MYSQSSIWFFWCGIPMECLLFSTLETNSVLTSALPITPSRGSGLEWKTRAFESVV